MEGGIIRWFGTNNEFSSPLTLYHYLQANAITCKSILTMASNIMGYDWETIHVFYEALPFPLQHVAPLTMVISMPFLTMQSIHWQQIILKPLVTLTEGEATHVFFPDHQMTYFSPVFFYFGGIFLGCIYYPSLSWSSLMTCFTFWPFICPSPTSHVQFPSSPI